MPSSNTVFPLRPISLAVLLVAHAASTMAQTAATTGTTEPTQTLPTVTVSADASADGLPPAFAGGQVARGARIGVLGNQDAMATPFSVTAYTNELIQDRQAKSVGEVLQNDPTVRVARGFGNFQESYFIRGFILNSDDVAYNGLYSLLPRQYIGTELFERVEVLRGASAFLNGANPGGGGIGGAINLVPKRAPNEPLNRYTAGLSSGGQAYLAADIARRFGPDDATGIRINAAARSGGTGIDDERAQLGLLSVGADWRSRNVRLSADLGFQDNKLKRTRTNVDVTGATVVPVAPDADGNWAQPWSYSNERDLFGTLRGEWDITDHVTAWGAYGMRRSDEDNSLANFRLTNGATGDGNTSRFDNARKDEVDTGEIGVRGKLSTGGVSHQWVASAASFELEKKNAYAWDFFNTQSTNLYNPVYSPQLPFSGTAFAGNDLAAPALNGRTRLRSFAVGDTLGFMGDTLLLTLGVRRQNLVQEDYAYDTGALTRYDHSRTLPAVGAVYKFGKQVSAYANYVEGLSQGEFAPFGTTNSGAQLAPYASKQAEVGVKFEADRLGGGVALFSTTKPRGVINAANTFVREGEDQHHGLEMTLHGEPMRGLRLLGGLTLLDTAQKGTNVATTEGKRVIGVPKVQSSVGVEWDVPGARGLALDARVVHTGAVYANAANTLRVPGWTRLDIGARYLMEVQGRLVTWRARMDNVANRNYWASAGGFAGEGYLVLGAPRTVSVTASLEF